MDETQRTASVEPVAVQDDNLQRRIGATGSNRVAWAEKQNSIAPPQVPEGGTTGTQHQPTNKEDAANGNENAIRHISYAEGYRDGKAEAAESPAAIDGEPVGYVDPSELAFIRQGPGRHKMIALYGYEVASEEPAVPVYTADALAAARLAGWNEAKEKARG